LEHIFKEREHFISKIDSNDFKNRNYLKYAYITRELSRQVITDENKILIRIDINMLGCKSQPGARIGVVKAADVAPARAICVNLSFSKASSSQKIFLPTPYLQDHFLIKE
jgi:hypothetical protein